GGYRLLRGPGYRDIRSSGALGARHRSYDCAGGLGDPGLGGHPGELLSSPRGVENRAPHGVEIRLMGRIEYETRIRLGNRPDRDREPALPARRGHRRVA